MLVAMSKRCRRGGWIWRRTLFRTEYSKFQSTFSVLVIIVVFLNSTSSQEYGVGGLDKFPRATNANAASNVYHYYVKEVLKQSENVTSESLPGLNALIQNLLREKIREENKQKKSESLTSPQNDHETSESKLTSFSSPVHSSHFPVIKNNYYWQYGNKLPGDMDTLLEAPLQENEFGDHYRKYLMEEQAVDTELGPLSPLSTELFEHHDPGNPVPPFRIKKVKEFHQYFPVISVAIVYLLISVLVYGAVLSPEDQCTTDMDMPQTNWIANPRRRFIPALSVDPYLQRKLLDLFHGYDEDDDDDYSDELDDIGMNEDYLAGELKFINSLCPTNAFFFSLSPKHIEAFSALKRLFLAQSSPEEMISLAKYLLFKRKVHPKVWYIALTQARLVRQDMAGFTLAHPLDAIPDWYIPADLITNLWGKYRRSGRLVKRSAVTYSRGRNSTSIEKKRKGNAKSMKSRGVKKKNRRRPQTPRRNLKHDGHHSKHNRRRKKGENKKRTILEPGCITVDGSVGIDNGIENQLWYWREDLQLNQHHWYWHQTHPPNSTQHGDRRAELFYYMHRVFIARYDAERLSNGMGKVAPLQMQSGAIIPDGYNSHLADIHSGIYWTPRAPDTPLQDAFHLNDPDIGENITLRDYSTYRWRLVTAMRSGRLLSENGEMITINHPGGIEELTNTVEASDLSVNPMFYGSAGIHTLGHTLIGLAADPDFRLRRVTGIMSDGALSMRDPSFYSYHLFLDNLFELHKQRLAPYRPVGGDFPLLWNGVEIVNVELHSQRGESPNELRTFWTHHRFDLSPGVDGSIDTDEHPKICAQHLDHEPFHFKIVIDRKPCVKSKSDKATIRIFMAPRYDEDGVRIPVQIQRRLMFPLDSFPVNLKVGRNTITRYAEDSSLTQPWGKSLRELERGPNPSGSAEYCGCGWPQHLYIPKGNPAGMAFDLFVMVTNYDEDYVPNDPRLLGIPETCNSPFIFCGLPGRRYPDKKPMGYPFDRLLFKSHNCAPGWTFSSWLCKAVSILLFKPFETLEQYVSLVPNMAMVKFHIKHLDTFLPEPASH